MEFEPGLERFTDLCEKVAGYYFTERYPMIVPSGLTSDDIKADKSEAGELIKTLFPTEM